MLRSWSPHTFERKVEFPFQIRKCRFREFTNLEKELKCESPLISKAWSLPRLPQGAPSFYREKQGPFDWLQVTWWTRTQHLALGPMLLFPPSCQIITWAEALVHVQKGLLSSDLSLPLFFGFSQIYRDIITCNKIHLFLSVQSTHFD